MAISVYSGVNIAKRLYHFSVENYKEPKAKFEFRSVYMWLKRQNLLKLISRNNRASVCAPPPTVDALILASTSSISAQLVLTTSASASSSFTTATPGPLKVH